MTRGFHGRPRQARRQQSSKRSIVEHGQMFHNGSYGKGVSNYAKDKNPLKFVDNIAKAYATAPNYASQVKSIIRNYDLQQLAGDARKATP